MANSRGLRMRNEPFWIPGAVDEGNQSLQTSSVPNTGTPARTVISQRNPIHYIKFGEVQLLY
jgi:hypothetical protein